MLFSSSITIPPNTTKANLIREIMPIRHGIISKIMVRPRPGHAGLAHLVIRYNTIQIAPSNEGMDFHGDAAPIDWEEYFEVYQPEYELTLQGWNEDDTYPHTFDVFVAILPRKAVLPLAISDAFKSLRVPEPIKRIFTKGA
ncbi:hypothetical protein LCGC14_1893680 [marine sediment metagenome]|uniref:Uncharacterized protein n=1 Tax=marine sediment metagenome TaxID=412755 RepID=A0A0F9FYZ5_9ZZZZ